MGRYEELAKLDDLRRAGTLTEEEFLAEKARLLSGPGPGSAVRATLDQPWGMETRSFLMLMHLSQFASFVVPLGGVVMPIVMWATCKDGRPEVDTHGRILFNWMLSSLIYLLISIPLCFVLIGIPLLLAIVICSIVFTIIGAVRANAGVTWRYPLSIRFFG